MKTFLRILNGIVFAPIVIPVLMFGLWSVIDDRIVAHYKKKENKNAIIGSTKKSEGGMNRGKTKIS